MLPQSSSRTRTSKKDVGTAKNADGKNKNSRKKQKMTPKIPPGCSGMSEVHDLTQPHDFCDVVLIVEGQKLHFTRNLLCLVSPVFKAMFNSSYVEKTSNEIPLPRKTFEAVHTLLLWVLPSVRCPITEENVLLLLPLSEEYCIPALRHDCMDFLIRLVAKQPPGGVKCGEILEVAELYNLEQLITVMAEYLADYDWALVKQMPFYCPLQTQTQVCLLSARMKKMESSLESNLRGYSHGVSGLMAKIAERNKRYTSKLEDLKKIQDKLDKTREALSSIEAAWKYGTEGVCSEHETTKTEGLEQNRNYSCPKCIQFFGFFLKTKCGDLDDKEFSDRYSIY